MPDENEVTTTPDSPAAGGHHPSTLFGAFDFTKCLMTEDQERHIRATGCCPRPECQPREGTAAPMRDLGKLGKAQTLHCGRCDTVWVVSAPNNQAH